MKPKTMNCNGRVVSLDSPLIMGIINITPDSFYHPSSVMDRFEILNRAKTMVDEGADIIDIGGMSTRPGAERLTEQEEWNRLKEPVRLLRSNFPEVLLSVDTFRSGIAEKAAGEGVDLINDISAGDIDPEMFAVVARLNLPYVAMHMQGTPQNMQKNPHYENVTMEIFDYFIQKISLMEAAGIKDIIIDPGFGFGKTLAHNYRLLRELETFQLLNRPLLVGVSRKSMIYKLLETDPEHALNGTELVHLKALEKGANILRVHDVRAARECIKMWQFMQEV